MGAEERRARTQIGTTGAPKHFRWDYLGSAATLDSRSMEGGLQVSKQRGTISQPDGWIHRRPVYTSGRPKGRIHDVVTPKPKKTQNSPLNQLKTI